MPETVKMHHHNITFPHWQATPYFCGKIKIQGSKSHIHTCWSYKCHIQVFSHSDIQVTHHPVLFITCGHEKRFTAHHHFTFLKHVLWIILSSHLSLFVSIIQTQTTKSKSLRMWPKRNGTLIKLHFVQDLWWFPVFTTANRFERANSEKNEFFTCTHISAEVKCYSEVK